MWVRGKLCRRELAMLARKMIWGKVTFYFSSRAKVFPKLAEVNLVAASNAIILIWNGHTQEFTHMLKVRPTFSLKCLRKCNLRCPSKSNATTAIVIVFWIIIIIFRLYYQESWSQTRGIWSDAWWEVYHCLFGAELLVSFCLKLRHVSAKN